MEYLRARFCLRTFGGTPNRDPCSLWGLIWGLPRDIGVTPKVPRFWGFGVKGFSADIRTQGFRIWPTGWPSRLKNWDMCGIAVFFLHNFGGRHSKAEPETKNLKHMPSTPNLEP